MSTSPQSVQRHSNMSLLLPYPNNVILARRQKKKPAEIGMYIDQVEQEHVDQEDPCLICYEHFEFLGYVTRCTQCQLFTHLDCLATWANTYDPRAAPRDSFSCPKCRQRFFRDQFNEVATEMAPQVADIVRDLKRARDLWDRGPVVTVGQVQLPRPETIWGSRIPDFLDIDVIEGVEVPTDEEVEEEEEEEGVEAPFSSLTVEDGEDLSEEPCPLTATPMRRDSVVFRQRQLREQRSQAVGRLFQEWVSNAQHA